MLSRSLIDFVEAFSRQEAERMSEIKSSRAQRQQDNLMLFLRSNLSNPSSEAARKSTNQAIMSRLLASLEAPRAQQKQSEEKSQSRERSTLNPQALVFQPLAKAIERNAPPPPEPAPFLMVPNEVREDNIPPNETVLLNTRDEVVFNNIGRGATLLVQEMEKVTINGVIEENVTIMHEGMGDIFINGIVHSTAQIGTNSTIQKHGAIHFAIKPPETVIDNLQKSRKGDIFIGRDLLPVRDEKEEEEKQIRLAAKAKALSERAIDNLNLNQEKEEPKDPMREPYIRWIEDNILMRIATEKARHFHDYQEYRRADGNEYTFEYAYRICVRKLNFFDLLEREIRAILRDKNNSISVMQAAILQKLKDTPQDRNQAVSVRGLNLSINQSKNRFYDFCKFLIGVLLSAPILFSVWGLKSYRDTFWNTRSKITVDNLVELAAKPPEFKRR